MIRLSIILLFALVVGRDVRGEIIKDPSLCSRTRCVVPAEQKFKYAEGIFYRYHHSVDVSTNLGDQRGEGNDSNDPNESTLFIDSTVTIHFASPCEGYLRISNASIRHNRDNYNTEFPDRADAEFKSHLENHPLRFAFDDGNVREVCPEAGEAVWSLNLKRGILSMLQNTMKRFDVDRKTTELDINGICETRYRLHEAKRTSLIIKKSKDLATCIHGGKHLSVVQSTFYRSPLSQSRPLSQPLLRSNSECEITIDHNIYESVVCRESHHLQPFSNGASAGARTISVAKLRLIEESKEEVEQQEDYDEDENEGEETQTPKTLNARHFINAKRTSLLYDHATSPIAVHGELRTSRDLLKSMCALGTTEELQQRFSEMYTKFIHSARLLDYPSMSQLLSRANSICRGGRKHIIDALPFIGSNAAVKVMRDLIRKKVVDSETTNEWVTAFALIPRPDATTLFSLMPILEFEREIPDAQFILSYSAVVHAFCANQENHCVGIGLKPIDMFLHRMEQTIDRGCRPRTQSLPEIQQTLEALKAIGNMGLETKTLSKRLKTCIDDIGGFLPMEIRVSAIDAHRRLPSCPETRDRIFLNYYRNFTLDSEIRIASYLQVMRCPDYNVIKMIKHTLKHEEVNQVGSFVWSHLTNLLASSSPTRVEIQSLLTDRDLGNKFNSDVRKYSRNYDKSFFSEEWNFGANYQSNLIFSSKSYVPRSATFNVTVDLFGESVNVFEISMRMEGMEYYVENIFGPEGPLSNEKVGNHFSRFLRTFRSAQESDEDHWRRVKRLPNVIDNNFDDPRISMSYKIFGNELRFKMLNGDAEIKSSLASLNPWTKVKQILSGKEVHYENTVMFLDSSYVVPTTSGLPVRLDLAGSAAYNFKLSGLLNSDRLSSNTEIEVIGNVTPSFSIDVTGRMIVDAYYKSAGLKLRSNVYSFGAVQLHLKIKGARLVRLGLDLPNSSMEVISVRTAILLVSTNGAETKEQLVGKLLTGQKSNKRVAVPESIISNTTCSWPSLERLIGLKLCADYQFPNVTKISNASYFILNGPTLFKVSVVKADPTAKSYLLEYKWNATPEQEYRLIGDYKNGTVDLNIYSPLVSHEHLSFHGNVASSAPNVYYIDGEMKNLKTSAISQLFVSLRIQDEKISKLNDQNGIVVEIKVTERDGSSSTITVTIDRKGRIYESSISIKGDGVTGNGYWRYENALNWNTDLKLKKKNRDGDRLSVDAYELSTLMNVQADGNTTAAVKAATPWKEIESFNLDGNMLLSNISGYVELSHKLNEDTSHGLIAWKLSYMIDMFGRIVAGINDKSVEARVFLKNPKKAFKNVDVGLDVNIDHESWRLGTNATVGYKDNENIDAVISIKLPPPDNDDHRLLLSYHAINGVQDARYVVGYNAVKAQSNYASDGSIRMAAKDLDGHLRLTWGNLPSQTLNNILNMTYDQKTVDFKYSLYTPKYQREETAIFQLNYDATPEVHSLLNADLYYPGKKKVGTAEVSFASLSNVNGTVNATTPIPHFSYAGCSFVVFTTLKRNKRYIEVFWPNNSALLNSDYNYHSQRLDSTLEGVLQLEIPLNTRHVGHMTYGYKKKPQHTTGNAELKYNNDKILTANYTSRSESRAGFEKDNIQITVENSFQPIGVTYVNQYEYSAGNAGTNYPTVEYKNVRVYRLDDSSAFNVSGVSRIRTTHDGQEIYLKGIHFNRTIQLKTDYEVLSGEFDQNTWLSLAEGAWASYHINIINKTTEDVDNQYLVLDIAYPRRNFTLDGSYKITKYDLDSEAKLTWDEKTDNPRTLGTAFRWKNSTGDTTKNLQEAMLSFRHPNFAKDVTFTGKLIEEDYRDLLNALLVVDYSMNPEKLLQLSAVFRDESETPADMRYSYTLLGKHPRTLLDLQVNGTFHKHGTVHVETDHHGLYKRSYLPQETGQLHGRIDANDYEIAFHRESNELVRHLNVRYYPNDPSYVVNGSIVNSPDLNATGEFYINIPEKLTWMMVNYTPDAVESLRMYGNIPDVRNAIFDIWRTYDQELVVSDVSFYLKLNHSRLVTSKLKWRPELQDDICNLVKTSLTNAYDEMGNDIDYWKQYIKSETIGAISDVWEDAREDIQPFLEDWEDLKKLEQDFDDLKIYLNDSYNANDFYIKDIVAIGIFVIDELSLRSHIQTLPKIINEIWEIMGESGEAIRNSLLWIIETMKQAYKKFTEIVSAVIKGESITQIANIVEKLIEKYDMFVKDLHVSFIKYIQNLWNKFSDAMSRQWNETLRMIEPIFIRVIHYIEAVLWKISNEIVGFLYDRGNEIIGSPYFDRFTNLTHDVDRIYRDIKGNDIVTNVQKYSAIVIQFIRERYFNIVPFGKELKELVDEIVSELKELTKLPTVHYTLEKINQAYDRAKYFYEYFGIRGKIEYAVRVIHAKLVDISQTALQAESRYREAKTKFIFDPNEGLMCLEQKLPMSWHAFNQTPEFQEIPEYRAIVDMKTYFATSNTTFWTLYYQYKPYTEPSNWLPPFKAQAMIVGPQHFITFDGRHIDFAGPSCTYLLARDFVKNHFAVLIQYDREAKTDRITHRIIVLIGRKAIELDIFKDTVKLVDSGAILQLPVELENGTAFVYQEDSIVTVETKHEQFKLRCNLKYDLCILELSGFYFGKTAGLLGTMNNEPMDDTLSSDGVVSTEIGKFARSWSLDKSECKNEENFAATGKKGPVKFCDWLFANKMSEFNGCFNVVSPDRYAETCANSRNEAEACTVAMSYMQMCSFYDTYLRIPDNCTSCPMVDGSTVPEGEFRKLNGTKIPHTTDVVFIVEAKECNSDIRQNRSIDQLISQLNKEFIDRSLTDNRWSLVTFGGNGVYDSPRNLILDSKIFTNDWSRFIDYFSNIPVGNGNQDVFAAIGFASQLVFRAGVSKTFVLMMCSHCEPQNQTLDYSVLHQVLLEHDITLHILMDGDFHFVKQRVNKMFYGLDAHKSYTRKDAKELIGDVDLRRQVKLSKSALGYCAPLSLETNGTIFSGNKLRFDKQTAIKKFASVFAKRAAASALPSLCQHCECTADNDGITHMECMPCVYPMPVSVDYVSETFNEDETLAILQPMDVDYGPTDAEDD